MSSDLNEPGILENIEKQLVEIEILKSIYPNSNEFIIEDEDALAEAQLYVTDSSFLMRRKLSFIIKFNADVVQEKKSKDPDEESYYQLPLEIVCRLPTSYPLKLPPDVFVRCLSRNLNRKFTEELSNYVKTSHEFDCSILNIIEWVKENIHRFLNNDSDSSRKSTSPKNDSNKRIMTFSRMFIYSHHIYSVNKRKHIVNWAKEFDLTGFSMPGKPGMICVEGEMTNAQKFWTQLKTEPWHKLQIKETQNFEIDSSNMKSSRKFDNFEEKLFSSNNDANIDIGVLFAFLKEKGLESIFNLYFGVDGKLPNAN